MPKTDSFRESRMRETRTSGLMRGAAVAAPTLPALAATTRILPDFPPTFETHALFGPSGVVFWLVRAYYRNVEKTNRRTAELEKKLDPNRTSSEPDSSNQSEADQ
jgi:hypothetical protein